MLKSKRLSFFKSNTGSIFAECFFTLAIFAVMLVIISSPKQFTSGTISGLKLFVFSVLPGLFPFMLLTKLLTEIGFVFKLTFKLDKFSHCLFGTPGVSIYAFLMSIISGYPIGAKIIGDLYDKKLISQSDAKLMSIFCTTSGPIFVIGTVGSIMFSNYKFGVVLYLSHILSSFLLGVIVGNLHKFKNKNKEPSLGNINFIIPERSKNIIADCVVSTINSLFVVGAYITMFYLIGELFDSLKIFQTICNILSPMTAKIGLSKQNLQATIYGILEVTRGAKALSLVPSRTSMILTSFILSFSGISIIMQSMAFLKPTGVSTSNFVMFKLLHAILSCGLCAVFLLLI